MYGDLGEVFNWVLYLLVVSVPLAIWKIIDIIIWLVEHVKVDIV